MIVDLHGPLAPAQVQAFYEVGFVVLPQIWTPGEVREMAAAFDALEAQAAALPGTQLHNGALFVLGSDPSGAAAGGQIQRVVWCGAAASTLSRFGQDRRLLAPVAQLLGSREMEQLINQAHFKLPGDGVEFPWHQDSRHRRYGTELWTDVDGRGSFVETVTAIDAMTPDNGPLRFIPGSGQGGHVPTDPSTHALPAGSFDPASAVTLTLEPGDVALFGPYVIHGSAPNRSDRARRTFLNGFAAPGANRRVYPGEGAGRAIAVDLPAKRG